MKLFLDTSVLLAAAASGLGASREVIRLAPEHGWDLLVSPYVLAEVRRNLPAFPPESSEFWNEWQSELQIVGDVLAMNRPAVFPSAKDRPVLFSALAWADVLVTLDRKDFGEILGGEFYSLRVLTPGSWLVGERDAGRLNS